MDVAFAPSPDYLNYCAVAIASLCHETKSIPFIRCHLLIDPETPSSSLESFERALEPFVKQLELRYYPVSDEWGLGDIFQTPRHIRSAATFYRLYLPRLLAGIARKVLYLDCDLVACRDISGLWDTDLGDASLGGVEESRSFLLRQALYLPEDAPYVNGGVLLWNLERLDVEDFERRLRAMAKSPLRPLIQFGDQDLLAVLLHDRTRYLPNEWNVYVQNFPLWRYRTFWLGGTINGMTHEMLKKAYANPGIVHYIGAFKPWNTGWFHDALSLRWFKYARMTNCPQEDWTRRRRRARVMVATHRLAGKPPDYFLHRPIVNFVTSVKTRIAERKRVDASLVARRDELLNAYNQSRCDTPFSADRLDKEADRRIGALGWGPHLDASGYRGNLRLLFATAHIEAVEEMGTLGNFDAFLWYFLRNDERMPLQIRMLEQALADNKPIYFVEPGPISSILNKDTDRGVPLRFRRSHSFIVDDRAFYFDALLESRIRQHLDSENYSLDPGTLARCRKAIDFIVGNRLTKYNFLADDGADTPPPSPRGNVLVIDQVADDASISRTRSGAETFEMMLAAALAENSAAEIYIKTHPDKRIRKKGFLGRSAGPRVHQLRSWSNPFSVLAAMDKVYACSSQLGFEALLAGRRVVTFGQAHYAGWGLTDDRHPAVSATRKRALEELFHGLFMLNTIYLDPWQPRRVEIEEYLESMTALRAEYHSMP